MGPGPLGLNYNLQEVAGLLNIKTGVFSLSAGESISLDIGCGYIFMYDYGSYYYGNFEIPYWESTIIKLNGNITNTITLSKEVSSCKFTITAKANNQFRVAVKYVFIGVK